MNSQEKPVPVGGRITKYLLVAILSILSTAAFSSQNTPDGRVIPASLQNLKKVCGGGFLGGGGRSDCSADLRGLTLA